MMRKVVATQTSSALLVAVLLLLPATFLSGCATGTLTERGMLPDVVGRRPPIVDLGPELVLLDQQNEFTVGFLSYTPATSLIDRDGNAHLFIIDKKKQLHHVEVHGDTVFARELLGVVESVNDLAFDAVEHPSGKLRVLTGDQEFIRASPTGPWVEIKGNRCTRFVTAGDDLFCACVIKGEEIGAPKRTDYYFFMLEGLPLFWWSNVHASKIVLAHESGDAWAIRAVLDPETNLDADDDFMVGSDGRGIIHFLYSTSRGGGVGMYGIGTRGGGGKTTSPTPELRYAQVAIDQLLPLSVNAQDKELSAAGAKNPLLPIHSTPISTLPKQISQKGIESFTLLERQFAVTLSPFARQFVVNNSTGEIKGLMHIRGGTLDDGVRKLSFEGERAFLEVNIRNGVWGRDIDIVAAQEVPDSTYTWWEKEGSLIKIDPTGNFHALLMNSQKGGWTPDYFINYLLKDGTNWSAPLKLGKIVWRGFYTLAVDQGGSAFAAWLNEKGCFVGRWIRPHAPSTKKQILE